MKSECDFVALLSTEHQGDTLSGEVHDDDWQLLMTCCSQICLPGCGENSLRDNPDMQRKKKECVVIRSLMTSSNTENISDDFKRPYVVR